MIQIRLALRGWLGIRPVVIGLSVMVISVGGGGVALAQGLAGDWVETTEAAIDEHRKTAVRVIVLDRAGKPAAGARVRLRQVRHQFQVGFVVPDTGWPDVDFNAPLWRCFNAIANDSDAAGLRTDALDREPDVFGDRVRRAGANFRGRGRGGALISADSARNPAAWAKMNDTQLAEALTDRVGDALRARGRRVDQFDLYANALDHDLIQRRLGVAMLRRLFELAQSIAPDVGRYVRVIDAFDRRRVDATIALMVGLERDFVPVTGLAIDQRWEGQLSYPMLRLPFERLGRLDMDVVLSNLEVGGDLSVQAAVNLEMVLRLVMATPNMQGVYFSVLTPDQAVAPNSGLLDADGTLSATGRVVDRLFAEHWHSDLSLETDTVGEVRARVFAGVYDLTATLADGQTARTRLGLPKHGEPRLVVLQPLLSWDVSPTRPPASGDAGQTPGGGDTDKTSGDAGQTSGSGDTDKTSGDTGQTSGGGG